MHVWQLTLDDLHLDSAKPKSIAVGRASDEALVEILKQHAKDMAITAQKLPRLRDAPHDAPVYEPAPQPGPEVRARPARAEQAGALLGLIRTRLRGTGAVLVARANAGRRQPCGHDLERARG
jgi:hypothetical protein